MRYNETRMLGYIRYKTKETLEEDPEFDGFFRISPKFCGKGTGLSAKEQEEALAELEKVGKVILRKENGITYAKAVVLNPKKQEKQTGKRRPSIRDKPENEAVRRWKKLSLHPPVYSHNMHIRDYLDEADLKYPDPEYWEGGEDDD